MKDLNVLKRLLLVSSLTTGLLFGVDELSNVLSGERNQLLDYQKEQTRNQTSQLEKSWISPVVVQYTKNYTTQFPETMDTAQFVISVDQPIFKMGGIWAAIKYANALGEANEIEIELQKRQLITQALTILYNLKKSQLQLDKLNLLIRNDELDILIQKESYEAGLSNRTLYDQALLKRNQDITSKLELELSITKLKNDFKLLSDDDPDTIALPHFGMIDQARYEANQLEVKRDELRVQEKQYNRYMTWSKYLPELSVTGSYVDADINPLFARSATGLKEKYYTYGFKVTLPLNINSYHDIQSSKIDYLNAQITLNEQKKAIANEFDMIRKRLEIIDRKIELSKDDAQHYASMQQVARDLELVGDRTNYDTEIVTNTLKVRELDQAIYKYDAQLELLTLYAKVVDAL